MAASAISFCAIRLEICENHPTLDHLEFNDGRRLEDIFKVLALRFPVNTFSAVVLLPTGP